MAQYANLDNGVAPFWEAIDVSAANQEPTGTCIGFYVEGAGDVAFVSGANTLTVAVAGNSYHSGQVSQFNTSGTTATGIYALYI